MATQPSRCVNQIEEVCRTIEKTINQTVQNTLNSLEKDCELISEAITDTLVNDRCVTQTIIIHTQLLVRINNQASIRYICACLTVNVQIQSGATTL